LNSQKSLSAVVENGACTFGNNTISAINRRLSTDEISARAALVIIYRRASAEKPKRQIQTVKNFAPQFSVFAARTGIERIANTIASHPRARVSTRAKIGSWRLNSEFFHTFSPRTRTARCCSQIFRRGSSLSPLRNPQPDRVPVRSQ